MVGAGSVKCAKCGVTSKEDPSLTFHRFPLPSMHGPLKAKVWAKYCYPDADLTDELLKNLYKQHKMLCGNHFYNSSFTSSSRKRLNKFAIPTEAQTILAKLRDEQNNPPQAMQEIQEYREFDWNRETLKGLEGRRTKNLLHYLTKILPFWGLFSLKPELWEDFRNILE